MHMHRTTFERKRSLGYHQGVGNAKQTIQAKKAYITLYDHKLPKVKL